MKIEDTGPVRPARPVRRGENAAAGADRRRELRAVTDSATIMGIPEAELTPKVRQAILALMAEVDKLRQELDRSNARIAYLERLADQDSLVPVANRRAFVRELTRFLSFAERYGTPSSLIYFDLNGLKRINDAHGHGAGDAALVQVGKILTGNVRRSDVVGRMGGDEFAVLLVHADEQTASEKARSIVAKIEAEPLQWNGASVPLTVAFGVYTFHGGEDTGSAIEAADRAMYARKHDRGAAGG